MSEGVTTTKMNTEFRRVLRKILRNPSAVLGFSLLIFFILVAIFAPVIAKPLNPMMLDEEGKPMKLDNPYIMPIITWSSEPVPPSREHPFGMIQGRDIFYGVVWGTRTAFYIGLTVTILSTIFGIIIGSIAGYYGGWIDEILMRITDTFMSIPFLLAAMVLTTILGNGLDKVMIAMTVFGWMGAARLIRANILQVKEEQFVLAAKALGIKDFFIIIKHILPNTIFPVLIQASMRMGSLVITAAGLSFLGLGAPLGYADWGSMLNFTRNWILGTSGSAFTYWYAVFYPGMAMVLFVLAWNLVGDALRDVFDPRLK
ncbi:ABC transporter permease [Fervidobacterium pennivorans subsp. shakshaketiis]|uniref:ABC-type dipeptide/oligopeptide/nickel transport system, permease component n=2 Tax=Fervidobacterium pennivorans TaxID=93466 RepID=H9UB49_FERPD|nr:ABC transporter permease [Fervidobacterium pennivorans]AFG34742.1 ABC-type dipeptide/oligopeptide/nickel transport system, permease component [Fervidobacterium pennivorans DSM 9078]